MFAIASDRPWNESLGQRLEQRTGQPFQCVRSPQDLAPEALAAAGVRVIFFPHWSHKIPATLYEAFECVVFHMTDLPYGRGGSPLQNLIVRGHEDTMLSALRCVEALDAGPVYMKRRLNLNGSAEEIFLRADALIESMIVEWVNERPEPVPQEGEPTVFRRRKPADSDWSGVGELEAVFDHIRMLDAPGYPPAFVDVGPFRLEFTRASRRVDAVVAEVRIIRRDAGEND